MNSVWKSVDASTFFYRSIQNGGDEIWVLGEFGARQFIADYSLQMIGRTDDSVSDSLSHRQFRRWTISC